MQSTCCKMIPPRLCHTQSIGRSRPDHLRLWLFTAKLDSVQTSLDSVRPCNVYSACQPKVCLSKIHSCIVIETTCFLSYKVSKSTWNCVYLDFSVVPTLSGFIHTSRPTPSMDGIVYPNTATLFMRYIVGTITTATNTITTTKYPAVSTSLPTFRYRQRYIATSDHRYYHYIQSLLYKNMVENK